MAECRGGGGGGDCLIKLFGKTIPVPEAGDAKDVQRQSGGSSSSSISTESDDAKETNTQQHQEDTSDPPPQPEVVDAEDPNPKSSSPPPPPQQHPGDAGEDGDQANVNRQREKLRKPDKVLPCPRCNSTDTKFCYFNNYNVNQPRHFCKNCQRYWTAGGAMRNVPVGAGRRKNKNAVAAAASHFLQRVRAAAAVATGDDLALKTSNGGGTVLSFGHGDLVNKEKLLLPVPVANHHQSSSSVGACSEGSTNNNNNNGNQKAVTADDGKPANGVAQHHPDPAGMNMWAPYSCAPSHQAYYPPGIAIPIYPTAAPGYWGCVVPGGWTSLPAWPPVHSPSPPTMTQGLSSPTSVSSGVVDSLTLLGRKHAREREGDEGRTRSNGSGKVWAPKTIRIDDADEVARSSIWSLISGDNSSSKKNVDTDDGRCKHGTVFEPKHDAKRTTAMAAKQAMIAASSPLLHANPVALTRSLTFQEGS